MEEEEEECLHYLEKLDVEEFEDIKSGYRIHFHYKENPFFENTILTKEFFLGTTCNLFFDNLKILLYLLFIFLLMSLLLIYIIFTLFLAGPSSNSTQIKWKEGKDLINILKFKQQTVRRKRQHEFKTFFEWFCDNSDPVNDEIAEVCVFPIFWKINSLFNVNLFCIFFCL